MAKTYTTVPAVATGDTYTSTAYNTYTKDNVNNLIVPPLCVLLNSGVSVTSTPAKIAFAAGTEESDTDSMHDDVTNNTRISIQTTGIYVVSLNVYGGTVSANGFFEILKNNTAVATMTTATNVNYAPSGSATYVANLTGGSDYLEARAFSGSTQTLAVRFAAVFVGKQG